MGIGIDTMNGLIAQVAANADARAEIADALVRDAKAAEAAAAEKKAKRGKVPRV